MIRLSKSLLVLSVLLVAFAIMLAACNKQESVKTEAKSLLTAPAQANAPACKAAVKKECKAEKKVCPKKAAKKAYPMMAEKKNCHKKAIDANDVKHCPMKEKKHCPPNCKKPCCAKKMSKCKAADVNDVNAPASQK